jgi:predicted nucleic acid-binding protein
MSFVIDASIVLSVLLPDENSEKSERFLDQLMASGAQAPNLLMLKVSTAIATAVRRKRIPAEGTAILADFFVQLRIEFDFNSIARLPEIRRTSARYALTTHDRKMQEAAKHLGIALAD